MTILVLGATGNVETRLVRQLRDRDAPVRAFVRNETKARTLFGDHVQLALGDLLDSASLRRALDGVERILVTSADGPDKVARETAAIDAALEAGVQRLVKLSTVGASPGSPLPLFDWHGRIEEHLREVTVAAVVLRCDFFMSNLLATVEMIKNQGRLVAPAGEGRIAMIHPEDVAEVAARVLTTDGHEGQTYTLTGGEALSYEQIAHELSTAIGSPVAFVDVPGEAAERGFAEAGMPEWLITHLSLLFGLIREGALAETTDTVAALTDHAPRMFAEFAREHRTAFTSGGTASIG